MKREQARRAREAKFDRDKARRLAEAVPPPARRAGRFFARAAREYRAAAAAAPGDAYACAALADWLWRGEGDAASGGDGDGGPRPVEISAEHFLRSNALPCARLRPRILIPAAECSALS